MAGCGSMYMGHGTQVEYFDEDSPSDWGSNPLDTDSDRDIYAATGFTMDSNPQSDVQAAQTPAESSSTDTLLTTPSEDKGKGHCQDEWLSCTPQRFREIFGHSPSPEELSYNVTGNVPHAPATDMSPDPEGLVLPPMPSDANPYMLDPKPTLPCHSEAHHAEPSMLVLHLHFYLFQVLVMVTAYNPYL